MSRDMSYDGVLGRKNEIMKKAIGIDYSKFETDKISFDYEKIDLHLGCSCTRVFPLCFLQKGK